ncbi:SLATT domain-containing protein [Vibrio parahaemolyticus]
MQTQKEVLNEWYRRVAVTQAAHYYSADSFNHRKYWLGVPTVILTTLVGTSVFATISQDSTETWVKICLGLASVAAALLASLQTFLGDSERSEKHRVAGAKYGALGRELEYILTIEQDITEECFNNLRAKLDELALESPNNQLKVYRRAGAKDIKVIPNDEASPAQQV